MTIRSVVHGEDRPDHRRFVCFTVLGVFFMVHDPQTDYHFETHTSSSSARFRPHRVDPKITNPLRKPNSSREGTEANSCRIISASNGLIQ